MARFDGGTMTSDAGALLLRQTDRRLNLLSRLAACFEDRRNPIYISHPVPELVSQRVYGLALGYEDLSDHDQLPTPCERIGLATAPGQRSSAGGSRD
jgi:hypothetical protein